MYSAYKLNKQGDNIQPRQIPFPMWNQSVVPCLILTIASWPAYRFLRRQVMWSGIPISKDFPVCDPHSQRLCEVNSLSRVWLFVTPWTVAYQVPPSVEFSRYWSGLPFLSPGDLPDPGIEPRSPSAGRRFSVFLSHQGSPQCSQWSRNRCFLELSCFFHEPVDVGNLISGSSAFSKSSLNIWKFLFMYCWSLA